MKKLFVSVPMQGRSEEDIKCDILKMKAVAEQHEGQALELIDSYITEEPPMNCNVAVWYLSKSIEKLATADVFIGIKDSWLHRGCRVEEEIAYLYGLTCYRADLKI